MSSAAISACPSLFVAVALLAGPTADAIANDGAKAKAPKSAPAAERSDPPLKKAPLKKAPAPRATKIAVLNPRRVRALSRWAQSLLATVDAESLQNAKKVEALRVERSKLIKQLELWEKGSREYKEKQLEIGVLGTKIQNSNSLYQNLRDLALAKALITVREEMQVVVTKLCEKRGIDLVLQQTGIPEKASVQQKFAAVQTQLVIFAKPELDLTKDVAKLLDAKNGVAGAAKKVKNGKDGKKKDGPVDASGKR